MEKNLFRFKCGECGKFFIVKTTKRSGKLTVTCSHCNFVQEVMLNPNSNLSLQEELRRIAEEKRREEEEDIMGAMCYCPRRTP